MPNDLTMSMNNSYLLFTDVVVAPNATTLQTTEGDMLSVCVTISLQDGVLGTDLTVNLDTSEGEYLDRRVYI